MGGWSWTAWMLLTFIAKLMCACSIIHSQVRQSCLQESHQHLACPQLTQTWFSLGAFFRVYCKPHLLTHRNLSTYRRIISRRRHRSDKYLQPQGETSVKPEVCLILMKFHGWKHRQVKRYHLHLPLGLYIFNRCLSIIYRSNWLVRFFGNSLLTAPTQAQTQCIQCCHSVWGDLMHKI